MAEDPYLLVLVVSRSAAPSWYQITRLMDGEPIILTARQGKMLERLVKSLHDQPYRALAKVPEGRALDDTRKPKHQEEVLKVIRSRAGS
jgi:hypothetical protein